MRTSIILLNEKRRTALSMPKVVRRVIYLRLALHLSVQLSRRCCFRFYRVRRPRLTVQVQIRKLTGVEHRRLDTRRALVGAIVLLVIYGLIKKK
jgi:hypothetical protein